MFASTSSYLTVQFEGEAIYSTKPWKFQNDTVTSDLWYTQGVDGTPYTTIYAIYTPLEYPSDASQIFLGAPTNTPTTVVSLLGYSGDIQWTVSETGGIVIDLSNIDINSLPSKWAWAFRLTDVL